MKNFYTVGKFLKTLKH